MPECRPEVVWSLLLPCMCLSAYLGTSVSWLHYPYHTRYQLGCWACVSVIVHVAQLCMLFSAGLLSPYSIGSLHLFALVAPRRSVWHLGVIVSHGLTWQVDVCVMC